MKKFKVCNTMTIMFHCGESDNSTNQRLIDVTRFTPIPVYCFCFSLLWYFPCTAIPPVLPFLLVCYEGSNEEIVFAYPSFFHFNNVTRTLFNFPIILRSCWLGSRRPLKNEEKKRTYPKD
jgi:hypothetical protein